MSRIGKMPISLANGVQIAVDKANVVTVKGPKGELKQALDPDITISVEDGVMTVQRPTEQKRHKALHGLYRALLNNMVQGVTQGFKKTTRISRGWLSCQRCTRSNFRTLVRLLSPHLLYCT